MSRALNELPTFLVKRSDDHEYCNSDEQIVPIIRDHPLERKEVSTEILRPRVFRGFVLKSEVCE